MYMYNKYLTRNRKGRFSYGNGLLISNVSIRLSTNGQVLYDSGRVFCLGYDTAALVFQKFLKRFFAVFVAGRQRNGFSVHGNGLLSAFILRQCNGIAVVGIAAFGIE